MSSSLVSSEASLWLADDCLLTVSSCGLLSVCAHLCGLSVCPNLAVVTLVLIRVD